MWKYMKLPSAVDVASVVQEFGTVSSVQVFRALAAESAAFHHGDEKDRAAAAKDLRDVFYVRKCSWETSVVERGLAVIVQALQFLAAE